eukprot:7417129-Ditylum_brightwellii.AAC.1
MPKLKKGTGAIVYRQKRHSYRRYPPSLHLKTTKKSEEMTPSKSRELCLQVPCDVALQDEEVGEGEDETTESAMTKILTKANEKHQRQIIVHLYQEVFHSPIESY